MSRLNAPKPLQKKTAKWRLILAAVLLLGIGGAGYVYKNAITRWYDQLVRQQSQFLGLSVQHVKVEGYRRTLPQDIQQALGVKIGDPMIWVELDNIYDRLMSLPWIKEVVVERRWPNRIFIQIREKEPFALWQHNYKVALIDPDGAIIPGQDLKVFKHLPLVIGEGAPQAAKELLDALERVPDIKKHIVAGIRISQRRWNLV